MQFLRPLLLLAVLLLAACASRPPVAADATTPATDPATPPFSVDRRQERHEFETKQPRVRIVNHYGDIRVRLSNDQVLAWSAVIQRIGQPPREPAFHEQKSGERYDLRIGFGDDAPDAIVDPARGRVDLVVFVPRVAALELETQDGTIQLRRFGGPLQARTRNGSMRVSSSGALQLESVAGPIMARQLRGAWASDSLIRSQSGDIELGLPSTGPVMLEVEAGRGVSSSSDWKPGEIEPPAAGARSYRFERGQAQPRLQVQTGGAVELAPVIELPEN